MTKERFMEEHRANLLQFYAAVEAISFDNFYIYQQAIDIFKTETDKLVEVYMMERNLKK